MKTRVGELTASEANAETRPYKIIGLVTTGEVYDYNWQLVVEYLDVHEYTFVYSAELLQHIRDGWHVVETDMNHTGACFILRRVKPESEPAAGVPTEVDTVKWKRHGENAND